MSKKRLSQTKKNIVFLGHMGSGKSTIGRGLSKKLGLDFYDTDKEIEKEMGQKIAKIFDEGGETEDGGEANDDLGLYQVSSGKAVSYTHLTLPTICSV